MLKSTRGRATLLAVMLYGASLHATASLAAIGYQQATIPDRDGKSVQAGIWYRSFNQSVVDFLTTRLRER